MGDRGVELNRWPRWPPSATSALLAVLGGVAWGLCFGQETHAWLACVALAPLVLLIDRPHGLWWAWLFAAVSWVVAMPWIATTLANFGDLSPLLAGALGVLLAVYLAADILLFAWLGRKILRRGGNRVFWALPALWVAVEALRGLPFGGFPWNLAAYAWIEVPGILPLASWIGAAGVSYLVAASNVAAAVAVRRRRWLEVLSVWLLVALLASLAARFATRDESASWGQEVRLVQPNTGIAFDPETAWQDYEDLIAASDQACDQPALLVWPESAAWPHAYESSARLRADVEALVARGCPVILGTPIKSPGGVLNAAILVDRDGPHPPYAKRRLVPFGEYVPLADLLPFVGNLARQAGDFQPGREPVLLTLGDEKLAPAICYEVVFASPVAEQVRAGATILLTITNDAWYGDSSAPHQHLRAARFRAAENRRPMLRAALTGISAIIDAEGKVVESLGVAAPEEPPAVIRGHIAGRHGLAPLTRAPWAPVALCVLLVVFAIIPVPRRAL